jgi:MSHA biogenesis protein MshJ
MQKGLVAPERMAPLLETILRANGRLKLVSLRTLPVEPLSEMAAREDRRRQAGRGAERATAAKAAARDLLFATASS